MAQWLDASVTRRIDWNDRLFSLKFECADFPTFKAGQFTKVGLVAEDNKILSRPYSLVNSPAQKELEILALPVEGGSLSPMLHELKAGDALKVMSPATGFLTLDEVPSGKDLWMIATGTGVGPFISILCDRQVWDRFEHVVLVFAVRQISDLAYVDLIEDLSNHYPDKFSFVPIVSRESYPKGLRGRIPALLSLGNIQQFAAREIDAAVSQIMLCGNPDMIVKATEVLEFMGLKKHLRRDPGQISMERYW